MNMKFLPDTEMGNLIRQKDWKNTSLGPIESWADNLHNSLSIMMNSRFPMFLFWGKELISFYNDAYRPSFGDNGMHPAILGKPAEEAWADIWHIVKKFPEQVLNTGVATWEENQLIPINRNGKTEDVYWTFSHSPVYNTAGSIEGIFVLCMETTQEVLASKKVAESEERFRTMAEASDILIAVGDETSNAIYFNKAWLNLTGRSMEDLLKFGWVDLMHPDDKDRYVNSYLDAFKNKVAFTGEFRVLDKNGEYRWVLAQGPPIFRPDGSFAGYISSCADITSQKLALEEIKRFEYMAENAQDPFILMREDGTFAYLNRLALEIWGYTAEETKHIRVPDVDPNYTQEVFYAAFAKAQKEKIPPFETLHRRKDGTTYPVEINMGGLLLNGKPHLFAVARDLTERKKVEGKIKESEQRFKLVADSAPVLIWTSGADARFDFFNKTWLDFTGRSMEQEIGNGWTEGVHPDDFQHCLDTYLSAFKKREPFYMEYRLLRHDGHYRWLSANGTPRLTLGGVFEGFIGACTDIHERIMMEEVLRESEEKFRLLAESMPQFVWTGNENGELNYFNQAVYNYSGLSREAVERDGWLQIVHPDDREENIKQWINSVQTGETFHFEHRFRGHNGEYRWQLSRAKPQRNAQGKIQMWVGTSTEIQEQKEIREKLEESVLERTQELLKANDALEEKNRELEKMNKELESFTYISSHDLQEPLRKIQTFSTRILQTENQHLTETGKDYFERLQNAAGRMQMLIEDLLAFSRTSSGERKFETTHLSTIVEEVQHEMKELISEKKAVIKTTELCGLNIIPFQFRQMLHNLISNAIKFAKPDSVPHILIESRKIRSTTSKENTEVLPPRMLLSEREYCHITVKDNGIGFDPQYNERIFEVFQRLHGKNEFAGTGIGLAIVKKIVDNHNGFIVATGEVGKGATFNIYIPVT